MERARKSGSSVGGRVKLVRPTVAPDVRHRDMDFQPVEDGEIKDHVKRHEPDGMAGKPSTHQNTSFVRDG